jgi:adenylate cyclase
MSISTRLVAGAAAVASLPLMALAYVVVQTNTSAVREQTRALHMATAIDVAKTIEISQDAAVRDLLAVADALINPTMAGASRIAMAAAIVAGSPSLDRVDVLDPTGVRIDSLTRGVNSEVVPTLPAGVESATTVMVGGLEKAPNGPARLWLWRPLRINGRITGYVATPWPLVPVQQRVERVAAASFSSRPNSLFVVYDGRIVADVDAVRAQALASADREPIANTVIHVGAAAKASGFSTSEEATLADGTEVVGSAVAAGAFVVVAQMPLSIVDAPVHHIRRVALLAVVLATIAASLIGFWLSRRITRPLARLVTHSQALAKRQFNHQTALSTDDELDVLATAMNRAGTDLAAGEQRLLEESRLREGLGRYLPEQLVQRFVDNQAEFKTSGERKELTILFVDICSFTPLTEKLSPEALTQLLNDALTIFSDITWKHGGTIDKFIGDSMMAFWGAPLPQADHADLAIAAARDMMRFLEVGNVRWQKRHGVQIELAIGIATGYVVVGNLGSERRLVYTAVGEAVNCAARLEAVAGPMQILVSDATRLAMRTPLPMVPLGPQQLNGIAKPIDVWAVDVS